MSKLGPPFKYLLVSLPSSITESRDHEEALTALKSSVSSDHGTTFTFTIPNFKIGSLDALVQQADELAKLSNDCEAVVHKVADSLSNLLDGDAGRIAQQKNINDRPVEKYLENFSWNKVKYRADKPIPELIDSLRKEIVGVDNDVKGKFSQYNAVKNNLIAAQRKQTGNLATKSLVKVVDPKSLIQDSDYLETHLLAVPKQIVKEYYKSYETLCPMIVPRSSIEIASDDEFILFGVTTFKKYSQEFLHKCREKRWTPRDFRFEAGMKEKEDGEIENLAKEERKLSGEALRLARAGYSESAMSWVHVLAMRVFVETVLRYGLPLDSVCGLIRTTPKLAKKAKGSLDAAYQYLGGNAFTRDKKGRVVKDDSALGADMQAAGHGGEEYSPYVYYEFEIN